MWTKMNERMLMEFVYKLEPNTGTYLYWSQVLLLAHAYLLSSLNSPEHSLVAPLISGSRDYISVDYIQMNHGSSNVGNEIDENALGKMAFYILRSVDTTSTKTVVSKRRSRSMTETGDLNSVPAIGIRPIPFLFIFKDLTHVFSMDPIGREILSMAFPAALALASDPVASLIDTAFIGRLGAVELAAVGVSIAIFQQASRITIFPIVSVTTSFVAEEDTLEKIKEEEEEANKAKNVHANTLAIQDSLEKGVTSTTSNNKNQPQQTPVDVKLTSDTKSNNGNKANKKGKKTIKSASTAMIIGLTLGLVQAIVLIFSSKVLIGIMGVKPNSAVLSPAQKYLTIRSLGAPALLLSLSMQGIFRGFKDTKTPLYATVASDGLNIIIDPIFIFVLRLGVSGAAIAHVISQYFMLLILLIRLAKEVNLMPPKFGDLQFGKFIRNGGLMLARTIAVTFCQTLAASMAARLGTTPMAAFQICLQVWLTSSMLADGLAVAGQAILACNFAEKDYNKVTAAASRVIQMSLVLGLGLSVFVGLGLYFGSGVFSKDPAVIHLIAIGIPFVAATQPINSLTFVLDGVNFGASDFAYTAYSMVGVAAVSIAAVIYMAKVNGFVGIWIALTIYMGLRAVTGIGRMATGTGPWKFLRGRSPSSS
ncbi:protein DETOXIFICATION 43-like isoform X2 [Brassica napus]|uniref:protein DETOXIFICATION 43-like isoform X2 n=2 Tax=Brassica napus TaxID=3708 RepID=UPI00207880E8|nr:protein DETOXIFICATION 43-like isoform X2 [Brassica napus]